MSGDLRLGLILSDLILSCKAWPSWGAAEILAAPAPALSPARQVVSKSSFFCFFGISGASGGGQSIFLSQASQAVLDWWPCAPPKSQPFLLATLLNLTFVMNNAFTSDPVDEKHRISQTI